MILANAAEFELIGINDLDAAAAHLKAWSARFSNEVWIYQGGNHVAVMCYGYKAGDSERVAMFAEAAPEMVTMIRNRERIVTRTGNRFYYFSGAAGRNLPVKKSEVIFK